MLSALFSQKKREGGGIFVPVPGVVAFACSKLCSDVDRLLCVRKTEACERYIGAGANKDGLPRYIFGSLLSFLKCFPRKLPVKTKKVFSG